MGAPNKGVSPLLAEEHLSELRRLTDTAGGQIVGTVRHRLDRPHPRYYVGDGKAEELKDAVVQGGAELVIFDEELSPAQGKVPPERRQAREASAHLHATNTTQTPVRKHNGRHQPKEEEDPKPKGEDGESGK